MTERLQIYKCKICGNIVQILHDGADALVCCGEKMKLMTPQKEEISELGEKHIPTIELDINGRFIRLLKHPMLQEHYIELIQAISQDGNTVHTKFFKPDEKAEFDITGFGELSEAMELCNIHGLWKS